jgi:chromosome segregation ATPase
MDQPTDQAKPRSNGPRAVRPRSAENRAAVIPIEARRERASFWKRLSVSRSTRRSQLATDASLNAPVIEKLDALDERLRGLEGSVELSAERLETRFLQFWEMEEQFGKLTAKVSELETSQRDAAERTRILSRSVTLLAVFALAAACVALALSLPLGA